MLLLVLMLLTTSFSYAAMLPGSEEESNGIQLNYNLITNGDMQNTQNILKDKRPFGDGTNKFVQEDTPQELKLGATGEEVKIVQQWLKDYGYYNGEIDGSFGPETDKAVKIFQEEAGLLPDGIVGEVTKNMMSEWDEYTTSVETQDTQDTYTPTYKKTYARKNVRSYYRSGRGSGDCWQNSANLYSQLTSSGTKARIIQYSTSQSSRHRSVQVYKNGNWVNYDYKANGYAQTYYATSNSVNGKVVTG